MQREKGSYSRQCSHRPVSSVSQVSQRKDTSEIPVGQTELAFWALMIYRHIVMRTHSTCAWDLGLAFWIFSLKNYFFNSSSLGPNRSISCPKTNWFPLVLMGDSSTQTNINWRHKTAVHPAGCFWYWTHLGGAGNAKALPVKLEGIKSQSAGHHLENKAPSSGVHMCTEKCNTGSGFSHCQKIGLQGAHPAMMWCLMWIPLPGWKHHSVCHQLLDFPFLFCMVFADRACYKYNICKNSTAETIPHFESACQTRTSDFFTFICNWSITLNLINPVLLSLWGEKQQNVFLQTWIFQKSVKNHAALVSGYYTEGCTYIYLFIGSQIEQRTLRPH